MPVGIGLLCLLAGGVAIFAGAALLRWLTITFSDAELGTVWDWLWTILRWTILDIMSSF